MARVVKRAAAKRDLTNHFVFLGENASVEVARRFLDVVRVWPVKGFERYLIFYRALADGVEILQVIHSARNIELLFR